MAERIPGKSLFSSLSRLSGCFAQLLQQVVEGTVTVQQALRLANAANGGKVDGLPYDLLGDDPAEFQKRVAKVIAEKGTGIRLGSVNKSRWCLAILRSGAGPAPCLPNSERRTGFDSKAIPRLTVLTEVETVQFMLVADP